MSEWRVPIERERELAHQLLHSEMWTDLLEPVLENMKKHSLTTESRAAEFLCLFVKTLAKEHEESSKTIQREGERIADIYMNAWKAKRGQV